MSLNVDEDLATEVEESPSFAPSVSVDNVQEMVRNNPFHVPERYLASQEELEKGNHMPHLSSEIPIIELLKLDITCKEWGFFQVISSPKELSLLTFFNQHYI